MNRERAKELLPVIQAFIDGKQIQCRGKGANHTTEWINLDAPNWDYRSEYRVAPEVVKVGCYAVMNTRTGCIWKIFDVESSAKLTVQEAVFDKEFQRVIKLEGSYER